jgi:hypothetical protein
VELRQITLLAFTLFSSLRIVSYLPLIMRVATERRAGHFLCDLALVDIRKRGNCILCGDQSAGPVPRRCQRYLRRVLHRRDLSHFCKANFFTGQSASRYDRNTAA